MTDHSQQEHWNSVFAREPGRFGDEPSYAANQAVKKFRDVGTESVLELGAGAGRDTLCLAAHGFAVTAVDYAPSALLAIQRAAHTRQIAERITSTQHDLRIALPFADATFDACYSHMLYCMAFSDKELAFLSAEVLRVLKPGGVVMYTARNISDPDYGSGRKQAEGVYEDEGFVVHFFDRVLVDRLARGYEDLHVEEFEEGTLPRKLFLVTMTRRV